MQQLTNGKHHGTFRAITITRQSSRIVSVSILLALFLCCLPTGGGTDVVHAMNASPSIDVEILHQGTGQLGIVRGSGTSVLDAPNGSVIIEAPLGARLTVYGRTADGAWAAVETSDGQTGWIPSQDVRMVGFDQLPVLPADADLHNPAAVPAEPAVLPTPTARVEPTPTAVRTVAPTPTPLPTVAPTAAPSASPRAPVTSGSARPSSASQVAVVRSSGADLAYSPDGETLAALPTGMALTVSGRTEDSSWLQAVTPKGAMGWVLTEEVVAFNVNRLPVVSADAQITSEVEQPSDTESQSADADTVSGDVQESETANAGIGQQAPAEGKIAAMVNLTDSRLNVRAGPGESFGILVKALPAQGFEAIGRNDNSTWIQVTGDLLSDGIGWVSAEYIDLSGQASSLLISDAVSDAASVLESEMAREPSASDGVADSPTDIGLQGNLVVQTRLGGDIYVVDMQSGASRYLVTGFDPAISPDGKTVAFTRDGGGTGLYLIDIDSANERRIFVGEGLRSPTFSPNGELLVFSRLSGEWECRDVGYGICLLDNPFLGQFDLVERPEHGLVTMNLNGEEYRDLPTLTSAKAPSWGPTGIAYQSNTSLELTSNDPDATTSVLLSAPYYQDPDWQPNGNRVLFQSREGTHWEIFSVNDDGSGMVPLTRPITTLVDELPSNVSPAWSPDGQRIIYLSSRDEHNDSGPWRLWVMNADGSGQRPLGIDLPIEYSYAAEQVVDWGDKPGM